MSNPRLLFNNVITTDNVSITGFISPNDIEGALSFLTYEFWEIDKPETISITAETEATADSLGIFGDGVTGMSVVVKYSQDAITYTEIFSGAVTQEGASFFLFDSSVAATFWKIELTVDSGSEVKIRNIVLGESLQLERCIMGSFSPATYNRKSKLISSGSGEAQFLSKKFIYQGFETKVDLKMMSAAFGRNQFQQFVNHANRSAYFFSWNPEVYPSEAIFGWTDDDIPLSYTGDGSLMASSWSVKR
jgi:hypothetical protein